MLLVVFNRPDLTRRVFERIREAQPSRLFIAADGPRSDRPDESQLCAETRIAVSAIDWPCEVHRLERDVNLGCKAAVSSAISWFFEHVEEGIILEDDCLPDPSFFPYCSELLERYRHETRVALIGSNDFQPQESGAARGTSYYFTKYPHIWGWATWRRTWEKYDVTLAGWNGDPRSLTRISNKRTRRHFAKRFDKIKAGRMDTWDFQLIHQCLTLDSLAINPSVNLVENIGFDDRATHTHSSSAPHPEAVPMHFPLAHPSILSIDESADRHTERWVQGVPPHRFASLVKSLRKRLLFLQGIFSPKWRLKPPRKNPSPALPAIQLMKHR